MREKPKRTDAVVDADDNDAFSCQLRPVVHGDRTRPLIESAAVDPEHHWTSLAGAARTGPDIQEQAVFSDWPLCHELFGPGKPGTGLVLHAARAETIRFADAVPVRCTLRRAPAQIADGRRRIGDTE